MGYPKDSLSFILWELEEPDRTEALEEVIDSGRVFTLKAAGTEPVAFWVGSRLYQVDPEPKVFSGRVAVVALHNYGERGQLLDAADRAAGRYIVEVFDEAGTKRRSGRPAVLPAGDE